MDVDAMEGIYVIRAKEVRREQIYDKKMVV